MSKPLAIDLFCGLGGWTEGLLAAGWDVVGFDVERHIYGDHRYPAQLVLQDVRTLHGSQFKDAELIVASSPCQEFSYRAMPWKRAKALGPPILGMELFSQAARIQREASEAAGHHIPMVQENVRGAQKYVGRAQWHYGSYYLWGDVPALMPFTHRAQKANPDGTQHGTGSWFAVADSKNRGASEGLKNPGFRFDGSGKSFQTESVERATKNTGGSWFAVAHNTTSGTGQNSDGWKTEGHINKRDGHGHTRHLTNKAEHDAVKRPPMATREQAPNPDAGTKGFAARLGDSVMSRRHGSQSNARKAASARIAKVPLTLARHIAETYYPR